MALIRIIALLQPLPQFWVGKELWAMLEAESPRKGLKGGGSGRGGGAPAVPAELRAP